MTKHPLFIGIDIGTSGVRACAIDEQKQILHLCASELPEPVRDGKAVTQDASLWWQATQTVLNKLFNHIDATEVVAICINGTSGTVLACDAQGTPLAPARMYNDGQCVEQAALISQLAPDDSAAHGTGSGLAKILYLHQQHPEAVHYCHQADWVAGQFSGRFDLSDANNALKSGYDPVLGDWPKWIKHTGINLKALPQVQAPGTVMTDLKPGLFSDAELNPQCKIISGTTDSIAAFIATGADHPGDAVTSLGSTLVLKIISEQPVSAPEYGIYSHKLGDYWLAGGASNSGGAVLKHYFDASLIDELSEKLRPETPTGLDYYPLLQPGERFPVNDPELKPRMEPRGKTDVETFQAILEGISRIELDGYKKLQQLGAPYPTQVETAGGGSHNRAWATMRQNMLGVPVKEAAFSEACYGSALLAMRGFLKL